jgi:ABC-2 type transport system permease protein
MRNMLLIARREFREKIRGRAFRISTVVVPLAMLLLLGGSFYASRNLIEGRHIAVVTDDPALGAQVRTELLNDKNAQLDVNVVTPGSDNVRTVLLSEIQSKGIDGFLWIDAQDGGAVKATYTSASSIAGGATGRLSDALNQALLRQRLAAVGIPQSKMDALLTRVTVTSLPVNRGGRTSRANGRAAFQKAMLETLLLTLPILLYGMDMARSIIEEKSSRIFEVLLATAQPRDLLTGKLLGVGAVGLTQIAIWVAAAALFSGSSLAASMMNGGLSIHFTLAEGILFPVYFVLGFLLYSSLFSGLAATCETAQELQMYTPLAVLPTWFSFGILPLVINDPGSKWSVIVSLFPATSPFVMLARVGIQMPPLWQIAVSLGLLVLSIWAVLWLSSRLYRVGILMYGKRATLPELLRWLRYS